MPFFERIQQIEQVVLVHPEGLTRAELARRLGVHRSTISRDIDKLTHQLPISEDTRQRLYLDRHAYLATTRLTMFELEALHLSTRLFAKVMKFPFPYASSALRKLADAQGTVSHHLADRMKSTAEEIDRFPTVSIGPLAQYRKTVEQLGVAITDSRPVIVHHYSRAHDELRQYRLFPLTLEPHPEGKAVHLLSWQLNCDPPIFRTLKIERIRSLELETPAPELRKGIPIEELERRLSRAWSIWTNDGPSTSVVLKFSPAVADRVVETLWHASQSLESHPDGSVIWSVRVSEPKEMYPWIRGWGPDVSVIEPGWLKDKHRSDFAAGAEMYRIADS